MQFYRLFSTKLFYQQAPDAETSVNYRGFISAMQWETGNREGTFQYSYEYDEHDRLKEADFKEKQSGIWRNTNKLDVTGLSYDKNGNIKILKRYDQAAILMDDLVYSYEDYTKLKSVEDLSVHTGFGFQEKANISQEYTYDDNGNMIVDENKSLDIVHNILNLPQQVNMDDNKSIEYLYSASAGKLAKYVYSGDTLVSEKNYLGSYVYNGSGLEYIQIPGGKVISSSDSLIYQYHITDHQGNIRVSYTKGTDGKAQIVQENHYWII